MARLRFYLDLRSRAKDDKGTVLISIWHNSTGTTMTTGIRLSIKEWSIEKQRVVNRTDADILNARLDEQKTKVERALAILSLTDDYDMMTASEVKHALENSTYKRKKHPIADIFEDYLSTSCLKPSTVELYRLTLKKVTAFGGTSLKIEDINYSWLRSFDLYLAQTQSINGRSIYLRDLRTICNHAIHSGIQIRYPYDNFHIKAEETRKRCVPVEVMREFLYSDTNPKDTIFKEYFFLMFYLIGINVKDLLLARKSQVMEGRLEYVRSKTRKKYSIKIEPEAAAIIERYSGKGEYLLEAMDHIKYHKSMMKEINKSLKRMCRATIPDITTYYARHCWATYAHEIGISTDTISQALGHSFGHKTTLIYIKPDQTLVDMANRKVIDYLTCSG